MIGYNNYGLAWRDVARHPPYTGTIKPLNCQEIECHVNLRKSTWPVGETRWCACPCTPPVIMAFNNLLPSATPLTGRKGVNKNSGSEALRLVHPSWGSYISITPHWEPVWLEGRLSTVSTQWTVQDVLTPSDSPLGTCLARRTAQHSEDTADYAGWTDGICQYIAVQVTMSLPWRSWVSNWLCLATDIHRW